MMKKFLNHLRQAERGQSIIILAIAFVVLLGFVGLTTDVSLMFVRYATIRRAVDSASIAAATQMRQGTEEATVAIAAKQFVEFHGLDAVQVLVDTCQTLDRADPDPEVQAKVTELCTDDQRKLVKVTVQAESPTVFLRLLGWENFTLQASALSETAALDVVLIMDVSESMLSETTYDDWAKIQMGWAFRPPHAVDDIAQPKIDDGVYGTVDDPKTPSDYWLENLINWQAQPITGTIGQVGINSRLWYSLASDPDGLFDTEPTFVSNGGTAQDPYYKVEVFDLDELAIYDDLTEFPADVSVYTPPTGCRVRFYPAAMLSGPDTRLGREWRDGETVDPNSPQYVPLNTMYDDLSDPWAYSGGRWNGFVPTYDYFGCCNDPGRHAVDAEGLPVINDVTGYVEMDPLNPNAQDFDFTDLICQPFKGARDAVEVFLEKIDFIRGDRVAFVTFDRSAFLINPWNQVGQAGGGSHMIDRYDLALTTLRKVVGVRAEPNFYVWGNNDGTTGETNARWVAMAAEGTPIDYDSSDGSGNYADSAGTAFNANQRLYHSYPVRNHCPYDDAALDRPYSLSAGVFGASESLPYPRNEAQDGTTLSWSSYEVGTGRPFSSVPSWFVPRIGYEFWSSCRGTNIGAALREGNNALVDPNTTRRFGAIWVMVLLGDGAAGASDPVRRNGDKLTTASPFNTNAAGEFDPIGGQYGSFGVCPFGTRTDPGEIVDVVSEIDSSLSPQFPYCSDEQPITRHDCDFRPRISTDAIYDNDYVTYQEWVDNGSIPGTGPESPDEEITWNQSRGNLYDVDIGDGCSSFLYDVDDYARDWADYAALRDPDAQTDELLPTIYTIGFGLTFGDPDNPSDPETDPDVAADYLGEQLLRYIADVGDNNLLDNDYYENFEQNGNAFTPTIDDGYGLRGPCQTQAFSVGNDPNGYDTNTDGSLSPDEIAVMYEPLDPTLDCGNYFNAPSADELEFVFDSIASKLFTRLAG